MDGLMIAFIFLWLLSWIGMIVAAFRVGVGWGILIILFPVTVFVFIVMHWQQAKPPFLVHMAAYALLVVGVIATGDSRPQAPPQAALPAIADPVYAQIRATRQQDGNALEQVILVESSDERDCKAQAVFWMHASKEWQLQDARCVRELEPRHAALFADQPADFPYLAAARATSTDRAARIVFSGYPAAADEHVCQHVQRFQVGRTGEVSCVTASR